MEYGSSIGPERAVVFRQPLEIEGRDSSSKKAEVASEALLLNVVTSTDLTQFGSVLPLRAASREFKEVSCRPPRNLDEEFGLLKQMDDILREKGDWNKTEKFTSVNNMMKNMMKYTLSDKENPLKELTVSRSSHSEEMEKLNEAHRFLSESLDSRSVENKAVMNAFISLKNQYNTVVLKHLNPLPTLDETEEGFANFFSHHGLVVDPSDCSVSPQTEKFIYMFREFGLDKLPCNVTFTRQDGSEVKGKLSSISISYDFDSEEDSIHINNGEEQIVLQAHDIKNIKISIKT